MKTAFFILTLICSATVCGQTAIISADISDLKVDRGIFLVTDNGLYTYDQNNVTFISNSSKTENSKSWFELGSKYINKSKSLKKRTYVNTSESREVDGNMQVLLHFISTDREHQLVKVTLDDKLKILEEEILTSFTYPELSGAQEYSAREVFRKDENSGFYYFEQYINVSKKNDVLSVAIFDPEMEFATKSTFTLEINYTQEEEYKYRSAMPKLEVVSGEIGLVNLNNQLYVIENGKINLLKLNIKYTVNSYSFASNELNQLRFIGAFRNEKNENGFALVDFDEELSAIKEQYVIMPKQVCESRREITGFGVKSDMSNRMLVIDGLKIDKSGNTLVVFGVGLGEWTRENINAVSISKAGSPSVLATLPWDGGFPQSPIFVDNVAYLFFNDSPDYYENGKFTSGENKTRVSLSDTKKAVAKLDFTKLESSRFLINTDDSNKYKGIKKDAIFNQASEINSEGNLPFIFETGGAKKNYVLGIGYLSLP